MVALADLSGYLDAVSAAADKKKPGRPRGSTKAAKIEAARARGG